MSYRKEFLVHNRHDWKLISDAQRGYQSLFSVKDEASQESVIKVSYFSFQYFYMGNKRIKINNVNTITDE